MLCFDHAVGLEAVNYDNKFYVVLFTLYLEILLPGLSPGIERVIL